MTKEIYVVVGQHSVTKEFCTQVLVDKPETRQEWEPLYRKWHGTEVNGFLAALKDAKRMHGNLLFVGNHPVQSEIQFCKESAEMLKQVKGV